jgi:hypothetical protein
MFWTFFCKKNRQHVKNIVFHSLLDCNFISLQFKKVLKCNRCHDNDNVNKNCMHVSAESMVIIWIKLTFADIFKFQIKKVFNDGRNDYAMSFNYMMLWKCYNMSYEFSISWLLCGFLAVLTTNEMKMKMRWFM